MHDSKPLTRREFTLHSTMAILGGVAISVSACDSDGPTAPTPTPDPAPAGATGAVGTNHGHIAQITSAELMAGGMTSLDITGTSSHPHTVELTADEVAQIGTGAQVAKISSTDAGHSHTVTFS